MEEEKQQTTTQTTIEAGVHEPALKKTKMSSTDDDQTNPPGQPRRFKRRKVAIFFAYCGVGYQGMQKNPGAKTIEGDLEEALYNAAAVPEDERGQPARYDWSRSSRTDKGVSAVGQVISGRFFIDPPCFVTRLNSFLSPQIRIFGFKRVTPTFNAKKFCDRRRYVYLLPVFALDSSCHRDRESVFQSLGSGEELVKCTECSDRGRKVFGVMGNRRDLGNKGILSNDCDSVMLDAKVKEEECLINAVGVVEDGVLVKSDDSDASLLHLKDEECNASVKSENVVEEEVKINGAVVQDGLLVKSGISSDNGAVLVSSVEEKMLENTNSVREELKNEVGVVISDIFVKSEAVLNNEVDVSSLKGEVERGEECPSICVDDNGLAELDSNGTGEGTKGRGCELKYGDEVKERFNRLLKYYEGTHNFHNYTTRTKAEDPSAKRYIVSFQANTTLTIDGIEFVKCEVVGQSFMLHQIRKMMGMAVAVMRNFASESIYETSFNQNVRINVPTAPEVGLYLDECFFTSYNNKWHETHEEVSMKSYAEDAEEFKLKHIYSHIADMEHKEGSVALWLHSLNRRNYPDLCQDEPQEVLAGASDSQPNPERD